MRDLPLSPRARGWKVASLEDLSDFITKGTTPTTLGFDWAEEGVLFLRSECVSEAGFQLEGSQRISRDAHLAMARSVVRGGDILITITGNVGRVALFPSALGEANVNQHIARVRIAASDRADAEFVAQLLGAPEYRADFERIVTGLAYPQISLRQVRDTPILLPPLPEQRKIAAILSSVDETIEKTEAVIEQLQVVKKAMMEELLTRGIPGRHTRFKKTEIGEIPEEWEVARLGNIATLITKGTTPTTYGHSYTSAGVPFLRVENVGKNGSLVDTDFAKRISAETHALLRRSQLAPGDVLISIAGALGRAAVVPASMDLANINQALALVRLTELDAGWVCCALLAEQTQAQIRVVGAQLAQANLSLAQVADLLIPVPQPEEREAIFAVLDSRRQAEERDAEVLVRLRTLKLSLSAALLSGDLRVTPDEDAA